MVLKNIFFFIHIENKSLFLGTLYFLNKYSLIQVLHQTPPTIFRPQHSNHWLLLWLYHLHFSINPNTFCPPSPPPHPTHIHTPNISPLPNIPQPHPPRPTQKSNWTIRPPTYLGDYHCSLLQGNHIHSTSKNPGNMWFIIQNLLCYIDLCDSHMIFNFKLSSLNEPTS